MKKIPSLFMRNYSGDRLVYNAVVEGSEWVQRGEGIATLKLDGTACLVKNGKLWKRYDRKAIKSAWKRHVRGTPLSIDAFKPAPDSWEACEPEPNCHTGHWPGWMPVGDGPEDQWHREGWLNLISDGATVDLLEGRTYELCGPKIGGNAEGLPVHYLQLHGMPLNMTIFGEPPRDFDGLRDWFSKMLIEGIVWHHPDGRMVKIKRRDFGYPWPCLVGVKGE